jgi:hypothetical protein
MPNASAGISGDVRRRDGLMSFEIDACRFLLAIRPPTLDCELSPEPFLSRGTHPTACP